MISENRKKHIFGVAEFLKQYATQQKMPQKEVEDLYVLGLLHDVGYAFLEEKDYEKHGVYGGKLLKKQGYKYWKEVYYHGEAKCKYKSRFLYLLNYADMRVNSSGNVVSFEERLNEIAKKYNKPIEDLKSYQVVCELKENGFK